MRVFACLLLCAASPALGATIVVGSTADDGAGCTLRDAIRTAQNAPSYAGLGGCTAGSAGVDLIQVPAGTYNLSAGGVDEDLAAGGDLDLREGVIIEGAARETTIIDGAGRDRVFHVHGGARVELRKLTIQNGDAQQGDGGGVYVLAGANLILEDAIVARNVSRIGGGGVDALGDFEISRTIIEGNRTQNDGGVRCLTSCTGRLTDVVIRNNTATGNVGGGLGAAGSLFLLRVSVIDNVHTGQLGAGGLSCLQLEGRTNMIRVVDSLIARNRTGGDGGGVRVSTIAGFFGGPPSVAIVNTTIAGNQAAKGAGVSIATGNLALSNVTIADNVASAEGGGIARTGGAVTLRNTIVARNVAPRGPDCLGELTSAGHNALATATGCALAGGAGDRFGDADLKLGALMDNGGASHTIALASGSPAINSGDPAGCTDGAQALDHDQRGSPRPEGGGCDIGAYELACADGDCMAKPPSPSPTPSPTMVPSPSPSPPASSSGCSTSGGAGVLAALLMLAVGRSRARR